MEKNKNKIDIEQNKLLALTAGCACCKGVLQVDEDEDFFPELTKKFDNLKTLMGG